MEEVGGLDGCFNGGCSINCIALLKLQAVSSHKLLLNYEGRIIHSNSARPLSGNAWHLSAGPYLMCIEVRL